MYLDPGSFCRSLIEMKKFSGDRNLLLSAASLASVAVLLTLAACASIGSSYEKISADDCHLQFARWKRDYDFKIAEIKTTLALSRNIASEIVRPEPGSRLPVKLPSELSDWQKWARINLKDLEVFSDHFLHQYDYFSSVISSIVSFHAAVEEGEREAMVRALEKIQSEFRELESKLCQL